MIDNINGVRWRETTTSKYVAGGLCAGFDIDGNKVLVGRVCRDDGMLPCKVIIEKGGKIFSFYFTFVNSNIISVWFMKI